MLAKPGLGQAGTISQELHPGYPTVDSRNPSIWSITYLSSRHIRRRLNLKCRVAGDWY